MGFSGGSAVKNPPVNAGDFDPCIRKIPGEGNGNPLQYSCLENLMDRGAWQATVHGIARAGHDLALSFFSIKYFQVFKVFGRVAIWLNVGALGYT